MTSLTQLTAFLVSRYRFKYRYRNSTE